MREEINSALQDYFTKWDSFVTERKNTAFFEGLKPIAVGWKVTDRGEYDKVCQELHDQAEKIIETWMNGRWVAKVHLRDGSLDRGVQLIKIMERRPGSQDTVGLDHVDFYSKQVVKGEEILADESGLEWTHESNDIIAGYEWLSIWFDDTEAKLKSDTVLDIIIAELNELNQKLLS